MEEEFGLGKLPDSAINKTSDFFREKDSEYTKEDFESDLIKASRRIKETKPSPKSS
jgi:hypothetical protein